MSNDLTSVKILNNKFIYLIFIIQIMYIKIVRILILKWGHHEANTRCLLLS